MGNYLAFDGNVIPGYLEQFKVDFCSAFLLILCGFAIHFVITRKIIVEHCNFLKFYLELLYSLYPFFNQESFALSLVLISWNLKSFSLARV